MNGNHDKRFGKDGMICNCTLVKGLRYDVERLKDELRIESATKAALQSQLNTLKEAYRHATS